VVCAIFDAFNGRVGPELRFDAMTPELSQQTVLITGAANGLGRALADAFGNAGATLALVDVDEEALRKVALRVHKASTYIADLSDEDATRRMIEAVRADHPNVNTLVHNAGYLVPKRVAEVSDEEWNRTFNVGIQAARLLTKAFWPQWLQTGGAAIYVSSRSGIEGFDGETAYCATKHALEGFVKALAIEGASSGIFVHAVTPGMYLRTPMSERNYPPELKEKWVDPIELTPAFLDLAMRREKSLSGQRLNAWELSQQIAADRR
jgi:NAD(P)-dependent dehydrogenase (short-subunit alcohol dehydrogenase family)